MKPTTPIVVLFAVLLFALLWLGILAQKADAPEFIPINPGIQTDTQTTQPELEDASDGYEYSDFGNDAGMELPIPDSYVPDDEESVSTENLEVI